MSAEIRITLDSAFGRDLKNLADFLRSWDKSLLDRLQKALAVIGQRWKAEAVKRVPVDTGNLKQRILTEVFQEFGNWTVACGTNVPYGKFLEFGTKFIAGGKVLRFGDNPIVTDADAIKWWPAKNAGFVNEDTGKAYSGAVAASLRNHERGGPQEEMPWLRSSLAAITQWAVQVLADAAQPPDSKAA